MKYDPIMCMMVDDSVKSNDELSLAQKKQVVTELKGFLKKSYNFSDESEYARAYEDIRQMFTTGSRKSISGLFENTVKKTGSHDEKSKDSKTIDHAIRSCDEQIRLVKTISKKNGYAIHIVESGYGEQIVLTFPNESYADPHMWLGPNNSSNIQRAKALLDAFSK